MGEKTTGVKSVRSPAHSPTAKGHVPGTTPTLHSSAVREEEGGTLSLLLLPRIVTRNYIMPVSKSKSASMHTAQITASIINIDAVDPVYRAGNLDMQQENKYPGKEQLECPALTRNYQHWPRWELAEVSTTSAAQSTNKSAMSATRTIIEEDQCKETGATGV